LGLYVSRNKRGKKKKTKDYFLAGKSLPWWAIGSSLIAANISAEQFIGMWEFGFAIGLAIAFYEWMAAILCCVPKKVDDEKGIPLTSKTFETGKVFKVAAYGVMVITVLLCAIFW